MSEPVDGILARLDLVGVEARRRSAEIEAQRTLPRDLVEALIDTGLFRLTVPSTLGGAEADVSAMVRAVRSLAAHDGSTGWVAMSALLAGLDAASLPRHHASTVLADPRTVVAGHRGGGGTARRTDDGGLVVTGRWIWGAGVAASSWITAGVRVPADPTPASPGSTEPSVALDGLAEPVADAPPSVTDLAVDLDLVCLFRRDQVVVLDTWHAIGLQGAGATDFQVTEAFVPEGRWIEPDRSTPDRTAEVGSISGAGASPDPFDRGDLLAVGAAAVALGLADRAIEEADSLGGVDVGADLGGRPAAEMAAAGAYLSNALDQSGMDDGTAPQPRGSATIAIGPDAAAAALHAVETSIRVVERAYRLGGPAAVLHASILQRLLRDVLTVAQHPAVSPGRWNDGG